MGQINIKLMTRNLKGVRVKGKGILAKTSGDVAVLITYTIAFREKDTEVPRRCLLTEDGCQH